jgi:carnitine-CoA ligase
MTELSVPLFAGPNPTLAGICGRAQPGIELRLVDEHDMPVPEGATGELLVRAAEPWTLSHGYLNDPAATARAWRNGWFHTGDLFRRNAAGDYFFVDRCKDAVRRRGENISSFEVERALLKFPGVREAAVVPVPGDGSEDEVLAVVAPAPGSSLVPRDLIQFVATHLAPFMVPRYVRVLDELPKTPTQKIEKHALRQAGLTPDTWDREAAGVAVRRDRLTGR